MKQEKHCPVCWSRHGKALLLGCCVCTGHVKLVFQCPTGTIKTNESACADVKRG